MGVYKISSKRKHIHTKTKKIIMELSLEQIFALIKEMGGMKAAFARRHDYADLPAAAVTENSSAVGLGQNVNMLYLGMLYMFIGLAVFAFVVVPARIAHHETIKKNVAPVEEENENVTTQV